MAKFEIANNETSGKSAKIGAARSSKYVFDPSIPSSSAKPVGTHTPRPSARPTPSKASSSRMSGQGDSFMTQAERAKLEAKEKKKETENCFDFLTNIKDVSRSNNAIYALEADTIAAFRLTHRKLAVDLVSALRIALETSDTDHRTGTLPTSADDPEYDNRTIFVPQKAWKDFTPFETQFWEIKQNHFDTVLFFQKVTGRH